MPMNWRRGGIRTPGTGFSQYNGLANLPALLNHSENCGLCSIPQQLTTKRSYLNKELLRFYYTYFASLRVNGQRRRAATPLPGESPPSAPPAVALQLATNRRYVRASASCCTGAAVGNVGIEPAYVSDAAGHAVVIRALKAADWLTPWF